MKTVERTTPRTILRLLAIPLVFASLVAAGCGPPGDCPRPETHRIENGNLEQNEIRHLGEFPQADVENATMRIDKEAGIVEVIYRENGEKVVETWGITGSSL